MLSGAYGRRVRSRGLDRDGRGLVERVLFSFMGPPQLGDVNAPPSVATDPAADLCHRCDQPWSAHERVRTASRGYLECPPGPSGHARS